MADLKILLLLAVTIGLIKCIAGDASNSPSTISPSTTSATSTHSPTLSATSSPASTSKDTSPTPTTKTDPHTKITHTLTSRADTHSATTVTIPNKDSPTSLPLTITSSTSPLADNKSVTTLLPLTTATTSAVSSDTQTTTQTPEPPSSILTTNSTKETKHSDAMFATSSPALNSNETSPTSTNKTDLQTNTTKISHSPATTQLNTSGNKTMKATSSPALTSNETSPTPTTETDPQTNTTKISDLPAPTKLNTSLNETTKATLSPAPTSNETSPTTSTKTPSTTQISPSPATTQLNSTVTFTTKDSPTSVPLTTTSSTSPLVDNTSVTTLLPRTTAATSAVSSDTQTTTQTPEPPSSTLTTDSTKQTKHSDVMSATSSLTHTSKDTSPTTSTKTPSITQSPTSLPLTHPNTTVNTTTKVTSITPAPSTQCSYTVTPIKFGLRINITGSTNGNYSINITEEGQREIRSSVVHFAHQTSHELKHLKSCTEYEHNVAFIESDGRETPCQKTENKTTTTTTVMNTGDIQVNNCRPGYVCYQSDWNISFSLSSSNHVSSERCTSDDKTLCIKLGNNDYCSDLTTTFTSGNCSLNLNTSITVDYINPSDIFQPVPTELPAQIEPEFPINCRNLSIDYTCLDELNKPKKLTDLEPFTDYICTGQIKNNNVNTNKATTVRFRVDCDLTINTKNRQTNTSIELSWDTTSQNCPDVPELKNLSYTCSRIDPNQKVTITADKHPSGGTCHFTGLQPFTSYTFKVQPTYNNKEVSEPKEVRVETEAGIPDVVTKLTVNVPENNVIKVKCNQHHSSFRFNGPKKMYIARLRYGRETLRDNNTKCDFEFRDLSYSTTYHLDVTAFNGYFEGSPTTKEVSTLYNDKAVIGFLIFLIILTSVALLLVLYKIFILKRRKSHDMGEEMGLITPGNDEENLLSVEPIAGEILLETYKRKLADEGRLFLAEFQSIPRIWSRYTVKEAKKSCNASKNRYVDILPYDYNRVQLTSGNGEAGCDYINASFIDGYKESKKYIAAQGPKEDTVSDFWRMIWEQQSSIIVMVTRCEEGNRVKCAQYWPSPDRETEIYEEFIVKLTSEDHCPDYTIRHLSLTNKREKNSEREVTHIQFLSWPDHGVPGEPQLLLKLRRRVNAFKNLFSGPIVVHCSAGVGRTGTYMSIDAMMEGLEAEGRVDIYGYIVKLRKQRCLMVQVEAQYILIHQALLEHNQFGETEIPLPELHSAMSTLKQKNSDNEPTLMEDEFERLPTYKNWRTFNAGITEENKKKNRSSSVIPYDFNRVLLKLDEGRSQDSDPDDEEEEESSDEEDEESTKYINASHIDGYWGPRALITAQTPLPDTMADFWLMAYQKKASAIVMLSDSKEGDKESDSMYWDKDKKTFGEIEVELVSTDTSPVFISRNMLIRHVKRKESRPVKQYQFLKWAGRELPEKPQELTDMIKEIRSSCSNSKSQRSLPIVVHCNDGSSRSGIFCAMWNLLESAETEKLVDVFQVAKTLRKERQGMLPSLEQYQFLYDALDGVFPVQNGDVKAAQPPAVDSVEIVTENKAPEQPAVVKAEEPASTVADDQQGAAENTPLVSDVESKGDKKEEAEKAPPTETTPLDETSNGPTVTVEA
ncbi:receptor-type tyrosine-protein phosphatase C-like isoform X4 [Channa argus]|uniref:receptor-type tyrosine-protein phosphatase C-like isoform X4 n=1 Tax=Channa argus TaxID=215402 RepID=UPI003520FDA4